MAAILPAYGTPGVKGGLSTPLAISSIGLPGAAGSDGGNPAASASMPGAISDQIQFQTNPTLNYALLAVRNDGASGTQSSGSPLDVSQIAFVESTDNTGSHGLSSKKNLCKTASVGYMNQMLSECEPDFARILHLAVKDNPTTFSVEKVRNAHPTLFDISTKIFGVTAMEAKLNGATPRPREMAKEIAKTHNSEVFSKNIVQIRKSLMVGAGLPSPKRLRKGAGSGSSASRRSPAVRQDGNVLVASVLPALPTAISNRGRPAPLDALDHRLSLGDRDGADLRDCITGRSQEFDFNTVGIGKPLDGFYGQVGCDTMNDGAINSTTGQALEPPLRNLENRRVRASVGSGSVDHHLNVRKLQLAQSTAVLNVAGVLGCKSAGDLQVGRSANGPKWGASSVSSCLFAVSLPPAKETRTAKRDANAPQARAGTAATTPTSGWRLASGWRRWPPRRCTASGRSPSSRRRRPWSCARAAWTTTEGSSTRRSWSRSSPSPRWRATRPRRRPLRVPSGAPCTAASATACSSRTTSRRSRSTSASRA